MAVVAVEPAAGLAVVVTAEPLAAAAEVAEAEAAEAAAAEAAAAVEARVRETRGRPGPPLNQESSRTKPPDLLVAT